ncbi:MAG: SMC-Scp complex subunit ScpB [Candidatus Nanopelagicales bacterium]
MAKKSKKANKSVEPEVVDVTDVTEAEEANDVVDVTDQTANEECTAPLKAQIEALLMVTDEPMTVAQLANLIGEPIDVITESLEELAESYMAEERGFELRNIAQGWRFYSARSCAPLVARYATDGQTARLTQASLETLAVVAYKQPVSRARVSAIRGVNVDGVMRTLLTRGLIAEVETDPATGALLYGTTPYFLERMGIKSVTELPPVEDHLPDMSVVDDLVETIR